KDLETPWGLAFLPDGRLLITERPGRLRIVDKGKLLEPVKGLPKVWEKQDGGLLDVEVHPQYVKNGWIYLAYSEIVPGYTPPPPAPADSAAPPAGATPPAAGAPPTANPNTPPGQPGQFGGRGRGGPPDPPSMTVVIRGKINANNEWTDQQLIFR